MTDVLRKCASVHFEIDVVASADDPWHYVTKREHDAYVIGHHQAQADGLRLIRSARNSGIRVPMILVTSASTPVIEREALDAGANDYIPAASEIERLARSLQYAVEHYKNQQTAQWLLKHDELTGLTSRNAMRERLEDALGRAKRTKRKVAILYMNIRGFRDINNRAGERAGDALLRQLASRLLDLCRPQDAVARLGGDEFLYLADELRMADDAHVLFQRINEALQRPFMVEDLRASVSVPMGAVTCPEDGRDLDTLITRADAAMQRARSQGDGEIAFWSRGRQMRFRSSRQMMASLEGALERNEFICHFQPIIRARDWALVGFEALLRWQHLEHGLVTPREFLVALERSDHVHKVGDWTLRNALQVAADARQRFGERLRVCVNISGRELLHVGLPGRVSRALSDTGVSPSQLQIEIAELALEPRLSAATPAIEDLRSLGVSVAVDGFGRSQDTFEVLMGPRVHAVKLGAFMLAKLSESSHRQRVVEAVVRMWKSLGGEVWADGVETPRDAEMLRAIGCDFLQGYVHGAPLSREKLFALLSEQPWRQAAQRDR